MERCKDCGAAFQEEGLFGGLCLGCLRDTISYDNGLRYLLSKQWLRFFMESVDGVGKRLKAPPLLMSFLDHEADDIQKGRTVFLDRLRDYILEDNICAVDYADWLEGREAP